MKFFCLFFLMIPVCSWSQICDVPKDKIVIADVGLGKSVVDLAKKHSGIILKSKLNYKNNMESGTVDFTKDLDKYWFLGTPINSFLYINYNKRNNLINGFNISFNLDDLEPKKFKNVLVEMYDLPKKGWVYKVDDSDPKYGREYSFIYKCKDYTINMSKSGFGSTMSVNAN